LATFGQLDFLCRFDRFIVDFGRFLDTVFGQNAKFLLETLHENSNFLWLFHAFGFAVSGYSLARPKV